jgi:hypothetical protein
LLIPRESDAKQYTASAGQYPSSAEQYPAAAAQYCAREIEAVGGRAFELKGAGAAGATRDFVLMRASGAHAVETARVVSDFEWTWLRFDGDEAEPRELIVAGGGSLRLDGREVLRSPSRINYFVARRQANDELIVETDAGEDFFLALSGAEGLMK